MRQLTLLHFLLQCYGMKSQETVSTAQTEQPIDASSSSTRYSYHKVKDKRKHPIRGLWKRNGTFYARITVTDPQTAEKALRWAKLEAETVPAAVAALHKLQVQREAGDLPVLKQTPKFNEYVPEYLAGVKGTKRESTLETERVVLGHWTGYFGETRLHQIRLPRIKHFITEKRAEGWSPRTANLAVTCLRNVLKKAVEDRWLQHSPADGCELMKDQHPKRALLASDQIDRLCAAAIELQNGQEFTDYIRLLAYSGARRDEALHLKWADVNWDLKQLTIGADGQTKSGESRTVDFNAKLEAHLRDMVNRRAPDTNWLFPSPRRGGQDRAAKTFVESLRLARAKAGLVSFKFHDLRHFFISFCVMSGIDFMTIAAWVGHADGGLLIGKVYGHLADDHKKAMADKLHFEPVVLQKEATA